MEQDVQTTTAGHRPSAALLELSVVLVTHQNDPSIFNPDFLRYNDIVETGLKIVEPSISTPIFSQVVFEGNFKVVVTPDHIIFAQHGEPLAEDACMTPGVAMRFLEKVPNVQYKAIGINPKGIRYLDDPARHGVADALIERGEWMSFKDVRPDIHLKALYNYEKRRISMDVSRIEKERNRRSSYGVMFQVNIHRDLAEGSVQQRSEELLSIVSRWKDDMSDFHDLVAKFDPERHL